MTKINKLTPAQEARFGEFRDKWLKIGLSTEAADRPRAEAGVKLAYEAAGLAPPKIIIWLDSPRAGAWGAALLAGTKQAGAQVGAQVEDQIWAQVRDQVRDQVEDQVWAQVEDQVGAQVEDQIWAQVGAQVRAQVGDQVGAQVRDQVGAQVWAQVWAQVGAQVWAQVWDQVWDQVGAQVWAQVGDQVGDQVRRAAYGQHDANWLAFYEFFAGACGLQSVKPLAGMMEISSSCGWWWPFANAVILTERPVTVRMDDQNRLHCEDGPAVAYRDGLEVYSWHGTRVPDEWIKDRSTLSPKIALTHQNLEQRRAACEILGWNTILQQLDARTIDKDEDPTIGELLRVRLPDIGDEQFLRVTCGTERQFALPVPPDMTTALQANAWTYGLDAHEYKPEVRT